jgi:hypothetical protein
MHERCGSRLINLKYSKVADKFSSSNDLNVTPTAFTVNDFLPHEITLPVVLASRIYRAYSNHGVMSACRFGCHEGL